MQVNMNLNVRSLNNYMEHVFSRLAKDLRSSVDFHYMASRDAKRPVKFREHVVALIVKVKKEEENVDPPCEVKETELLDRVIPFVACCVASLIPMPHDSPSAGRLGMTSYDKTFILTRET